MGWAFIRYLCTSACPNWYVLLLLYASGCDGYVNIIKATDVFDDITWILHYISQYRVVFPFITNINKTSKYVETHLYYYFDLYFCVSSSLSMLSSFHCTLEFHHLNIFKPQNGINKSLCICFRGKNFSFQNHLWTFLANQAPLQGQEKTRTEGIF